MNSASVWIGRSDVPMSVAPPPGPFYEARHGRHPPAPGSPKERWGGARRPGATRVRSTVYVTSFSADTIVNFSAAPQGQLTFSDCVSDDRSGGRCADAPGTPLTHVNGVAVSPDGTSVYATAQAPSDVVHFFRQATAGGSGGGGGGGGGTGEPRQLHRSSQRPQTAGGRNLYTVGRADGGSQVREGVYCALRRQTVVSRSTRGQPPPRSSLILI
jgi:hypothetical protein